MNTKLRVQEKAVSTDPELQWGDLPVECESDGHRVHHILAALVNRKVISIKAGIGEAKLKWQIQPKLLVQKLAEKNSKNKRKLGRRKGRCMHSCHKHHHHNYHHHHQHRHDLDHQLFHHHHHHCDGVVRHEEALVRNNEEWPAQNPQKPVPYLGGHILTAALQRSTAGMSDENRPRGSDTQHPKTRMKKKNRRTRFGEDKQNAMRPHPVPTIHPDDLPQRARWTIIITAGLLLITCMLLVGVTLRMAPVIDELVRNQNEELMNSLDREEFGPSENSTDQYNTYK